MEMLHRKETYIHSLPIIKDGDLSVNVCEFDDQVEILIIKPGICSVRLTIYEDVPTTGVISSLFVHGGSRRERYGTVLMHACADISKVLGLTIISLFVKKDTFVHKWYNKLGFIDYMISTSDAGLIELINVL